MAMREVSEMIRRRLLPRVAQPGQYIGLETNAHCGDVDAAEVTVVLAYPDAYSVGISHLGGQVLYALANGIHGVACDRTYCPLPDAEAVMRHDRVPLFGWESRRAVSGFDVLGFSLAHEGCLTNVLTMLDLAGVPLRAANRGETDPLVIAGDAGADTPEPMAPFIDLFCVGDGEVALPGVIEVVRQAKRSGARRDETILQAARTVPGAYAPRLYEPRYNGDGRLASLRPVRDDVPARVGRARVQRLSDFPSPARLLVPLVEAVHDRVTIEIMRGCPHGCRFCQAGATRKPVRWRGVEEILDTARRAIAATGYREISLLSLSSSDYPHFGELAERLAAEFTPRNVSLSLPSLRVDSQLAVIPKLTSQVRKTGLTIAAEAGSERLRRAIRKDITEAGMVSGVEAAWRAGWRSVKIYFMAGLPGERDEDVEAIFDLCRRLSDTRKAVDGQRGAINAAVSWLVPRPHTPMQWEPMRDAEYFWSVRRRLRDLSRRSAVQFKFHHIERSGLEGALARGDRRVADAIEDAWRRGARFDAWNEHFSHDAWVAAFEATGIDPAFYAARPRDPEEVLPWDHIESHRGKAHLLAERQRMMDAL